MPRILQSLLLLILVTSLLLVETDAKPLSHPTLQQGKSWYQHARARGLDSNTLRQTQTIYNLPLTPIGLTLQVTCSIAVVQALS